MKLKDWQGKEYAKGSRVVYISGDSYGNSYKPGIIEDIQEKQTYGRTEVLILFRSDDSITNGGKISRITNQSRIMVL